MRNRQKFSVGALACISVLILAYQNCGPGFKVADLDSEFGSALGAQPQDIATCSALPNAPRRLSETCLLDAGDGSSFKNFRLYEPQYPLYSDGATKRRWMYIPEGAQINTQNPDAWIFPKGTVAFKEFVYKGKKIETRVMEKVSDGAGATAWRFSNYAWRADQLDADLIDNNFYSTADSGNIYAATAVRDEYRLLTTNSCATCHGGGVRGSEIFDSPQGFGYLQLSSRALPFHVDHLNVNNWITNQFAKFDQIPGTDRDRKAIGYLQSNCATCHNGGVVRHNFLHRSSVTRIEDEAVFAADRALEELLVPGNPNGSRIYDRFAVAPTQELMPPRAQVPLFRIDMVAANMLADWITNMPTTPTTTMPGATTTTTTTTTTMPGAPTTTLPYTASPPPVSKVRAETIVSGLAAPWGMAFLPDGRALVTQKSGQLLIVDLANRRVVRTITSGVPAVAASGQGGLLDVAISPNFANDRYIYFTYAEPVSGGAQTAVARARLSADESSITLVGPNNLSQPIFRQNEPVEGSNHFGSRLTFSPDGTHLFVSLGDRDFNYGARAMNVNSYFGKIIRIRPDGSIPADNPTSFPQINSGNAAVPSTHRALWSIGHRNPQGLAFDPNGVLWESEHGPQGGDEVQIIVRGGNYGWSAYTYGVPYGSTQPASGHGSPTDNIEDPETYFVPSIAPSNFVFYSGPQTKVPSWRGDIFQGALAGTGLYRLDVNNNAIVGQQELLGGLNVRIRNVEMGPDGFLYTLDDSGFLRRVVVDP